MTTVFPGLHHGDACIITLLSTATSCCNLLVYFIYMGTIDTTHTLSKSRSDVSDLRGPCIVTHQCLRITTHSLRPLLNPSSRNY